MLLLYLYGISLLIILITSTMSTFYKKTFLLILFTVLCSTVFYAQVMIHKPADFWSKVRYGGGLGMRFGDGFFSGTLAPSAIYQLDDVWAFGVGLNGTYNKQKDRYQSTVLGGSLLSLINPIDAVQLSAEFDMSNVSRRWESQLNIENQNYWYPALFIGAGYHAQNITVGIRYDVLYDKTKSIYADAWAPFVRVYF